MSQSFWCEETPTGKFKFVRRYRDPNTNKLRRVSITRSKRTKAVEREVYEYLGKRIEDELNKLDGGDMTVSELFDEWSAIYRQTVKPSTYNKSMIHAKQFVIAYGDYRLKNINSSHLNRHAMYLLTQRQIAYQTTKSYMNTIALAFRHAFLMGYIASDPSDKLHIPRINVSERDEFKFLERDELNSIIQQLKDNGQGEISRLCQIQALTGMRFGELLAINYKKHINYDDKTLSIEGTYNPEDHIIQTPKSGNKRLIHLNDTTLKLFRHQTHAVQLKQLRYGIRNEHNFLFISHRTKRPFSNSHVNNQLKACRCDKYLTTHIFRHTFVTRMVEAGVSSKLIAEHVGHANTDMVERVYSHFTELMNEKLEQAIESVQIM